MARDVHILGAGLSGTCLALRLAQSHFEGRIVLYDVRDRFDREQHLCAWAPLPRYLKPFVQHAWSELRVVDGQASIRLHATGALYQQIHAPTFFQEAHRRLRRLPNVELRLGTPVDPDEPREGYVLDARNTAPREARLRRSCFGYVVAHEEPVFGRSARLMHFGEADEGLRFFQVLPFGPHQALVETSLLGPNEPSEDGQRAALEGYLRTEFPGKWRVLSSESGSVPIGAKCPPPRHSMTEGSIGGACGAVGGLAGTALPRIVDQVERVASAIVRSAPLPAWRPRRATQRLTQALHDVVLRSPDEARRASMALFALPAEVVVRFMMDRATWSDAAAVLGILPRRPVGQPSWSRG